MSSASELVFLKFSVLFEVYKSQFAFQTKQPLSLIDKSYNSELCSVYVLEHKVNHLILTDGSLIVSPLTIPDKKSVIKKKYGFLKNHISIKLSFGDYLKLFK
jgi:hypothetical protein